MVWGCLAGSRVADLYTVRGKQMPQPPAGPSSILWYAPWSVVHPTAYIRIMTKLGNKEQDGTLKNMEWSAQYPHLNPNKLVWDELDTRMKLKQVPHSYVNLCNIVGNKIPEECLISIVERMSQVCESFKYFVVYK